MIGAGGKGGGSGNNNYTRSKLSPHQAAQQHQATGAGSALFSPPRKGEDGAGGVANPNTTGSSPGGGGGGGSGMIMSPTSAVDSPASPLSRSNGAGGGGGGPMTLYNFPQLTEREKEHWKVFNELDNKDEADMLALAAFFQTLCATAARQGNEALFPAVDDKHSQVPVERNIRILNVGGRIDSNLHDLQDYQIPPKSKVTMDVALDIIDCYRRGGKVTIIYTYTYNAYIIYNLHIHNSPPPPQKKQQLHVASVQKILKGVYWLYKKFPNVRPITLPPATRPPPLPSCARASANRSGGSAGKEEADVPKLVVRVLCFVGLCVVVQKGPVGRTTRPNNTPHHPQHKL